MLNTSLRKVFLLLYKTKISCGRLQGIWFKFVFLFRSTQRRSRVRPVRRTASWDPRELPDCSPTMECPEYTTLSWTEPSAPAASLGSPAPWPGASTAQTSSVRTAWWLTRYCTVLYCTVCTAIILIWRKVPTIGAAGTAPLPTCSKVKFNISSSCTASRGTTSPRWGRSPATRADITSR